MNLVDTHAHLYWDSFKEDFNSMIQRSIDARVTTIINVGVNVKLSKIAADQVRNTLSKIPDLKTYSTIGIHPHEAANYPNVVSIHEDIDKLQKIYQTQPDQIVAVGECGLDFSSLSYEQQKDQQRQLFQIQINLAKKLNLPLIVHVRDDRSKNPENTECWDEVLNMIGDHPTILHCYSGLLSTTKKVLSMPNLLVSFAATITYPKNEFLRQAAKVLPLEKIVLETDCPFLPPQSKRGKRNEPSNIKEIAELIASLKETTFRQVAQTTTNNVTLLFAKDKSKP